MIVTNSTTDCKASVNTIILIPPRNVYNQIIATQITTQGPPERPAAQGRRERRQGVQTERPGVEGRRQAPVHLLEAEAYEDRRHADVDRAVDRKSVV